MGFLIVYKKLIFKGIRFEFRITRIMFILEKLNKKHPMHCIRCFLWNKYQTSLELDAY